MKYKLSALILIILVACGTPKEIKKTEPESTPVIDETLVAVEKIVEKKIEKVEPVAQEAENEVMTEERYLFENNCAKCHSLYKKTDFDAMQWQKIVLRMQPLAKITDAQRDKILKYLTQ